MDTKAVCPLCSAPLQVVRDEDGRAQTMLLQDHHQMVFVCHYSALHEIKWFVWSEGKFREVAQHLAWVFA